MASSSTSENATDDNFKMSPELARQLFDNGGTLVILNFPIGSVFGIDMKVFNVGEKFRGIKMIPPGLHFIYYSAVSKEGYPAPRTGFFHYFSREEIIFKKWDKEKEDLADISATEDEIERIRANLQELDPCLGPYPYQALKNWNRLSCNISESLLKKLQPLSGVINSVTQLVPLIYPPELSEESVKDPNIRSHQTLEERYLPNMKQVPGTEIRFSNIPDRYPKGCSAAEMTKHNMDSTYALEQLLSTYDKEEDILGELQMALVCFLIAHVYDAFEHWKKLLQILCSVDSGLEKYSELFTTFLTLLHFQIKEIPTDFFVDITSNNNFLLSTLHVFFENVKNSNVNTKFQNFVSKFKKNLTKTYKWDFECVPDDEKPVIVDL